MIFLGGNFGLDVSQFFIVFLKRLVLIFIWINFFNKWCIFSFVLINIFVIGFFDYFKSVIKFLYDMILMGNFIR